MYNISSILLIRKNHTLGMANPIPKVWFFKSNPTFSLLVQDARISIVSVVSQQRLGSQSSTNNPGII